jgi:F-type H+-transporting ATPase subunit a
MDFYSPLEQFEVNILGTARVGAFSGMINLCDIIFDTFTFYLFFILSIIIFFSFAIFLNPAIIGNKWQYGYESVYRFVLSLVRDQIGSVAYAFFPIFFCVFYFILFSNLIGLVPFSFTVTAHISLTFAIALAFNFAFTLYGFFLNGFKFLFLFVPNGAPVFLLPLIIVIEVVSYLIRTLSLSVRLFANMMAGHTLLHILSSFVLGFVNVKFPSVLVLFPLIIVILVFFLEFGIAFIQAYVFTILLCIYLNDAYNPGH